MTWKIKITSSARKDITEIKQWYEKQSRQTLKNFTDELIAFIESLKEDKTDFRPVYENYRKLSLK
jgi:plasmid stabilization system protein ParE